jgi:NADH-quinone oxidoreductase subunit L
MAIPLVVLAGGAAVGGIINLPIGKLNFLDRWLASAPLLRLVDIPVATSTKWVLGVITVALCVVGVGIGARIWSRSAENPALEPVVLRRAWGVDDLVSAFMDSPGRAFAAFCAFFVDSKIVDGAVNGVASVVRLGGGQLRRLQTGYVRNYAWGVAAGAALLLGYVVVRAG